MSKRCLVAGLGVLALVVALAIPGLAQGGMGPGGSGGPRGPGGPGMMGPGPNSPASGPVSLDRAAGWVNEMIRFRGDDDLAVEEVMEFTNHFYVLVKEKKTGIGAFELIVERSGFIYLEPGPNIMWNTKYHIAGSGPLRWGWSGPNAQAQPVTVERARQIARQHLSTAFPGATPDLGTAFYGYFTFDVGRDGRKFGMLSVNVYIGQVWYHAWHGTFVREKAFQARRFGQ